MNQVQHGGGIAYNLVQKNSDKPESSKEATDLTSASSPFPQNVLVKGGSCITPNVRSKAILVMLARA
jgi:hypothetical protein